MPQFSDVPEGFEVKPTSFSDIPPGFTVATGSPQPARRSSFVGPMQEFGVKDVAIGAGDLLVSGARSLVNKPAATAMGLANMAGRAHVGDTNFAENYRAGRDRFRGAVATDDLLVKDERLRTPQGQTLANMMRLLPQTREQQALGLAMSIPGDVGERVGGEAGRETAESALMLATLRTPKAMTAQPRNIPAQARRAAPPARTPAPSAEELRAAAGDAYTSADNAGVIISRDAMARIAREIKAEMADEGIDATLHPDSMAALNRLIAAGAEHTSLKGAEILRRVIKDAEAATKPADAQKASMMRDAFDERIEALGGGDVLAGESQFAMQSLQNARQLYSRARKAEDIQDLFRNAELAAGANYTAAGIETALRQQFRALAKSKRRMRGFTAEERAAIEHVAKGGTMDNLMRYFGKFTASGPLAAGASSGLGFMFGGPLAALGVPAAGWAARQKAAQLTLRNAQNVSEMVRRGPQNALSKPRAPENALVRRR